NDRVVLGSIEAAVKVVFVEKPRGSNETVLDDTRSAPTAGHISSLEDLQPGLLHLGDADDMGPALIEADYAAADAVADVAQTSKRSGPEFRNNGRLVGQLLNIGVVLN